MIPSVPLQHCRSVKASEPVVAPSKGTKKNPFICGSEAAGKISPAAGLQKLFPSLNHGVGGFITNALGGNAFSGATDLIHSFATGEGGGHSVFYNMGQGVAAGPTQGFGAALGKLIEGTPFAPGPVDAVMTGVLGEYASGSVKRSSFMTA